MKCYCNVIHSPLSVYTANRLAYQGKSNTAFSPVTRIADAFIGAPLKKFASLQNSCKQGSMRSTSKCLCSKLKLNFTPTESVQLSPHGTCDNAGCGKLSTCKTHLKQSVHAGCFQQHTDLSVTASCLKIHTVTWGCFTKLQHCAWGILRVRA